MDDLLGKTVRNTVNGEVGTVRGVKALDVNGEPGVYVEVPVVTKRGNHPHMNRVWNVKEIEVVDDRTIAPTADSRQGEV